MRKVTEVSFHQTVFVRGIGQLDKTISTVTPAIGAKTIEYDLSTDGVALYMKLSHRGAKAEVMVPAANVVFMLLAPENEKPVEQITLKTKA